MLFAADYSRTAPDLILPQRRYDSRHDCAKQVEALDGY
jgi:hypothetical protein